MRTLILTLFLVPFSLVAQTFVRKDSTISHGTGSWNITFYTESRYYGQQGADSAQMIIFFPEASAAGNGHGPLGLSKHGPLNYIDAGWDGGVQLGNGRHYPIIVAVEQVPDFPSNVEDRISTVITALTNRFRVISKNGRKSVHLTGISAGGAAAKYLVTSDPYSAGGPWPNAAKVLSVTDVQGVKWTENDPYPALIENFARAGGRMVSFEGENDFRDHETVINRMNATVPNSGIYYKLTNESTPMASHCCWNFLYGGFDLTTGSLTPAQLNFDGQTQNIYQWMLRQGDTTLKQTCVQNIWKGTVDNNWHNQLNWSCNAVPTINTEVFIPSGVPYICTVSSPASCRKITIENGGRLTNKSQLTVAQSIFSPR